MPVTPAKRIMRDRAVDFEPRLVEECVLLAIEGAAPSERREFRRERNAQYELPGEDSREAGFQEMARRWFMRLGLENPLLEALEEQPAVLRSVSRTLVLPAISAKEETADLHESQERDRPVLAIRLRPTTLADPRRLLPFLRHELQHVADMLDPEFAYDRTGPADGAGPVYEKLLRERYRVLWDTTVDGRLSAQGLLDPGVEEMRRGEFQTAFGMLGESAEECFQRFFRGPRPRHGDLWGFAAQLLPGVSTARRCPLCALPSASFHAAPESMAPATLSQIRQEFPAWNPESGLCVQCADLYASRDALVSP